MDNMENYKIINAQMSKTIAKLKSENTRLQDENKKSGVELLRTQNLVINLQNQVAESQKIHIGHVSTLTKELQSLVCKMNEMVVKNNESNQTGEQSLTNLSANKSEGSRRMSRSYESPVQQRQSVVFKNDEGYNVASLDTITEEIEQIDETGMNTPNMMQSILTTQCQSTIANHNSINSLNLDPDASTSIQSDIIVVTNFQSIASNSIDSNKENQPSQSSNGKEQIEYSGTLSPFKNGWSATDRRRKQNVIDHSNEDIHRSGVVSSTPYKRIINETNNAQSISNFFIESDVSNVETEATPVPNAQSTVLNTTKSFSTLSNDSTTIATETSEVEIVPSKMNARKALSNISNGPIALGTETTTIALSNTRPKRNAITIMSFKEPKLNTKLRRPRSPPPKVRAKPKRN